MERLPINDEPFSCSCCDAVMLSRFREATSISITHFRSMLIFTSIKCSSEHKSYRPSTEISCFHTVKICVCMNDERTQ